MKIIIIPLLLIILILCFYHLYVTKKEEFEISPFNSNTTLIYSSNKLNDTEWIDKNQNVENVSIEQLLNLYSLVANNSPLKILSQPTIHVVADPLDYDTYLSNSLTSDSLTSNTIINESPTGYFVVLAHPIHAFKWNCSFDLQSRIVGYFDISDLYFIKALIYGYKQNLATVTFKKLNYSDINNLADMLKSNQIDIVITYIIPNSQFFLNIQLQNIAILGFENLNINRIRVTYPYITDNGNRIPDTFKLATGSQVRMQVKNNTDIIPAMKKKLVNIKNPIGNHSSVELFDNEISVLNDDYTDKNYRCYGNPDIISKGLCESPVDLIGLPKKSPTKWDKPCKKDDDCPFYNSTKRRGGCDNLTGFCEMPVGAKRIAYRFYSGEPFCYDCNNDDYVFNNDFEYRKTNNLITSPVKITPL